MSPRRPSSPRRRSARIDTSVRAPGVTGMWTRRPSVVMTTATARRSCRSKRPKLASRHSFRTAQTVRCAQSSKVRVPVNVPPKVLGVQEAWRRAAPPCIRITNTSVPPARPSVDDRLERVSGPDPEPGHRPALGHPDAAVYQALDVERLHRRALRRHAEQVALPSPDAERTDELELLDGLDAL